MLTFLLGRVNHFSKTLASQKDRCFALAVCMEASVSGQIRFEVLVFKGLFFQQEIVSHISLCILTFSFI